MATPIMQLGTAERPRGLIVTVYGAYARALGGWLSIGDLISLMAPLGVDDAAVRSAIARLKQRGLLQPERRGSKPGYALSEQAERILCDGDRRIFRHRQADLSDGWVLAVFSIPESQRRRRHALRSELAGIGFGNAASGVWIAPAHQASSAQDVLERLSLTSNVTLFRHCHLPLDELDERVSEWWDLDAMRLVHTSFIDLFEPVLARWERLPAGSGQDAFVDYIRALRAWRRIPFLDPGLPLEVLPPDWPGPRARSLFRRLHERLGSAALGHVRAVVSPPDH